MLNRFLSAADATRADETLEALARHDLSRLALTGGFALELHIHERGGQSNPRPLHDIDFLAADFDSIPGTLARDFLFNRVHPSDPPGKTLLQAVFSPPPLRIDVFRAYRAEMERTVPAHISALPDLKMVSIEDLTARLARLCLDLADGKPVSPKFARDFLRVLEVTAIEEIEPVWPDHRKPNRPETFAEAARELRDLIASRSSLLIAPTYSKNANEICPRCRGEGVFGLGEPKQILSLLGYR